MKTLFALAFCSLLMSQAFSQTEYAYQTFDDTRIVNSHSIETNTEGVLKFIIGHRFGPMNSGPKNLWGLDFATMRMGLDYGLLPNISIGLGRSSVDGTVDTFAKYKFLSQSTGDRNMPVSATVLLGYAIRTKTLPSEDLDFTQKSSYTAQLLIARKFGPRLSAQLMPTIVHRNLVADDEQNDLLALGMAAQYEVVKNWSLSAEYYLTPTSSLPDGSGPSSTHYPSLSAGFQVDTKGHIFQFQVSNSSGMTERIFISETDDSWSSGRIFFGFNITRDFTVKGRKIR